MNLKKIKKKELTCFPTKNFQNIQILYAKTKCRYILHKLLKYKRFSETPAFKDQKFRQKTKLINEVSQLANGVTDSMSELQDVQESVLDMKKFLNQS